MGVKHKLLGAKDWNVTITGTDISSYSISRAQKGAYSQFDVQMGLNMRQILENFHLEGGMWQINDDIAAMVEFRRYNLMDELTHSDKYDIIFCRYVLQYFPPEIQRKLIAKIYSRQMPSGFLYLGMNETVNALNEFYQPVNGIECLYQAKPNVEIPVFEDDVASAPQVKPQSNDEDDIPSFVRPQNLTFRAPPAINPLKEKN